MKTDETKLVGVQASEVAEAALCCEQVELFCAQTPKTCKNFLALAASGWAKPRSLGKNEGLGRGFGQKRVVI